MRWTLQFGTESHDSGAAVALDDLGNVFITGITRGSLGGPHVGSNDVFVAKLVVPEPGTLVLLIGGGLGLVLLVWPRRKTTMGP